MTVYISTLFTFGKELLQNYDSIPISSNSVINAMNFQKESLVNIFSHLKALKGLYDSLDRDIYRINKKIRKKRDNNLFNETNPIELYYLRDACKEAFKIYFLYLKDLLFISNILLTNFNSLYNWRPLILSFDEIKAMAIKYSNKLNKNSRNALFFNQDDATIENDRKHLIESFSMALFYKINDLYVAINYLKLNANHAEINIIDAEIEDFIQLFNQYHGWPEAKYFNEENNKKLPKECIIQRGFQVSLST